MDKKFLVCGGDMRQISVADMLCEYGYAVNAFGFDEKSVFHEKVHIAYSLSEALLGVDIVVLPLPCTIDNETIHMPLSQEKVMMIQLLRLMNKNQMIVAGKVNAKVSTLAQMHNIYVADYFEREELAVLNAIPTAEGAIQIAMEETAHTIHGSRCLVLGYGRIGKLLSASLKSLGASVTVSARQFSDLAWVKANGYQGVPSHTVAQVIGEFDIIFNTVPSVIIDERVLKNVRGDSLIIDLASKPGGIDFEAASYLEKRVIWALSLPGKVAPITAGKIITDTIINLVEEMGV